MAAFELTAMFGADAAAGALAWVLSRSTNRWLCSAARISVLLCLSEIGIIGVMMAAGLVWAEAMPIWAALAMLPFETVLFALHIPSLIVLGFDEVLERHGVLVPTVIGVLDLVLWSTVVGYARSRIRPASSLAAQQIAEPDTASMLPSTVTKFRFTSSLQAAAFASGAGELKIR